MTRFFRQLSALFVMTSLLVSQTSGALAKVSPSPESPSALAPPTLVAPNDGAFTNNTTPTFSWQADAGAVGGYEFQLDESSDFSLPLFDQFPAENSFTPGVLTQGTYYWRVQSNDGVDWSGWSIIWSVTVDTTPPAAPALNSPPNGVVTNDNAVGFDWDVVPDANAYHLQVSTDLSFSPLIVDLTQSGTHYFSGGSTADGKYYWRVNATDLAGNTGDWSEVWSLTVDTNPPAVPDLLSPGDGALTNNNTPAFTWSSSVGDSQYRLQVDNSSGFGSPEIDQWLGSASFTPISALADGTYFWHVQAKDLAGNLSGWSTAWSVVIDTTPPVAPSLLSPGNTSLINDTTPAFSWNSVAGANVYHLQVSTVANFASLAIDQTQATTTFTSGSPLVDGIYYWRVNATDTIGNIGAWSAAWSFTLDSTAPLAPTLLSPADASFSASNTPAFNWSIVSGASKYHIQVSTAADFSTQAIDQDMVGNSFTPGSPLADGTYYWRVNATDTIGNTGVWSAVWSLTIDTILPAVPGLLAPTNGAALADTTPDFTWNPADGATSYRLQIGLNGSFSPPLLNQVVNGTGFSVVNPLNEGSYSWRVRASDAAGNTSAYSAVWNFTIDTTPPSVPALVAPADGASTNDNTPTFTWSASTGASQYQILVDDSSDFASPVIDFVVGSTGFTAVTALSNGTYYWRVRAIDAAGNLSGWSTSRSLVIDATPPVAPTLIAPLDGAFTSDNTPTFSWNAVTDAVQYQIQADDDITFTSLRYEQFTSATTSTPASALSDALLHWRVRVRDAVGNWSEWSLVRDLTIDTLPPASPALVAPADGTITADNTIELSWGASSGASQYQLQVDNHSNFSGPNIDQTLSVFNFTAVSPLADAKYYWRVRAIDAAGNMSGWASARNFTIDTTASNVPTQIGPGNGALTSDSTPTFTWNPSTGATGYTIQVDDASNFNSPLISQSTATISFTPTNAIPDGTYFWHVQATDAVGNLSAWSSTWSLVIDTVPPGIPSLVSPQNGLVTNDNSPSFTWNTSSGAVQFEIQVDNNNDFSSTLVDQTVGSSSYTSLSTLTDGSYFWRVRALDAAGNQSGWSVVRSLTIDTTAPALPSLFEPLQGSRTVDNTPTFLWSASSGATQYWIQVDSVGDFSNPLVNQIVNQASFTTASSLAKGVYGWRVKAGDAAGNWSAWSEPWSVEILDWVNTPFSDGFESANLGVGWTTSNTYDGRVRVALASSQPGLVVGQGNYSLFLDDSKPDSQASQAAAILTANLNGMIYANLSFTWCDFGDETDGDDGVYISSDYGANWYEVLSFDGNPAGCQYKQEQMDLLAKAAFYGLALNDHFMIKFQFMGNNPITADSTSDGYGIDSIHLVGLKYATYLPLVRK